MYDRFWQTKKLLKPHLKQLAQISGFYFFRILIKTKGCLSVFSLDSEDGKQTWDKTPELDGSQQSSQSEWSFGLVPFSALYTSSSVIKSWLWQTGSWHKYLRIWSTDVLSVLQLSDEEQQIQKIKVWPFLCWDINPSIQSDRYIKMIGGLFQLS